MVKTAKHRNLAAESNGHHKALSRKAMPVGPEWEKRIARGLRRWREKIGLSVEAAAEKFGINNQIWRGIEDGNKPQKTGKNLNLLCEKIGVDNIDLQKLGMDP